MLQFMATRQTLISFSFFACDQESQIVMPVLLYKGEVWLSWNGLKWQSAPIVKRRVRQLFWAQWPPSPPESKLDLLYITNGLWLSMAFVFLLVSPFGTECPLNLRLPQALWRNRVHCCKCVLSRLPTCENRPTYLHRWTSSLLIRIWSSCLLYSVSNLYVSAAVLLKLKRHRRRGLQRSDNAVGIRTLKIHFRRVLTVNESSPQSAVFFGGAPVFEVNHTQQPCCGMCLIRMPK